MFILKKDIKSKEPSKIKQAFDEYYNYLETIKDKLPPTALNFAKAEWHYNPTNPKCLHDSWVENVCIKEIAEGKRREKRTVSLKIRLFGAYQDGYTELVYTNLNRYNIMFFKTLSPANIGHGDWLYDEIRTSEGGFLLHEIEFSSGIIWTIESNGFSHSWIPIT